MSPARSDLVSRRINRPSRSAAHRLGLAALALSLVLACDRPQPERHFVGLTGTIESCNATTGEVVVSAVRGSISEREPEAITCVFPHDAEIYVDDRLCTLADVQAGETGELIGYFDANPRLAQFVVTCASFERGLPPAPWPPELSPLRDSSESEKP